MNSTYSSRRFSNNESYHQHYVAVKSQCQYCRSWKDMSTATGKRCQMIKIIVLSVFPGIILIVQNSLNVNFSTHLVSEKHDINTNVMISLGLANVVHFTQIERGMSALYVSSARDAVVKTRLQQHYLQTDNAVDEITSWISRTDPEHFKSKEAYYQHLLDFRQYLSDNENITIKEVINFYSDDNEVMISNIKQSVERHEAMTTWLAMVAYHMLIISKEQAGIERALGSTFYARGHLPQADLLWYQGVKTLGDDYLKMCIEYSEEARTLLQAYYTGSSLEANIENMRAYILQNNSSETVADGVIWFDNMTEFLNILKTIQDKLAGDIVQKTNTEIDSVETDVSVNIMILVLVILLLPAVVLFVHKLTSQMQVFAIELQDKTRDLEQERKRTETLLYQMLPVTVANKMISNQSVLPENYQSVTIFFSDVVGFTAICSRCSPMDVVDMLNIVYVTFDDRLEHYDVYKVETIGDGYMVASGLPNRNGDRHVAEAAGLALDLMETVHNLSIPQVKPAKLRLRIGLNTGPVVAGVVGHRMPRYCVFGDTVNTASRMESTGLPLRIQCSEPTYSALQKYPEYVLQERGQVEIKGKGKMTTYWLMYRTDNYESQSTRCLGHHSHQDNRRLSETYSHHFSSSFL